MKITLKNVSYSAALSDETAAFSATVCIDGVPSFGVSNHGQGGNNDVYPIKGQTLAQARENEEKLDAYAETLPRIFCPEFAPINGVPFSMKQSADSLINDFLQEWQRQRDGKRILAKLSKKVLMFEKGRLIESNVAPAGKLAEWVEFFVQKYPEAVVLNRLTPEAAAEIIYRQVLA